MARDLMGGDLREVVVEYDPSGALVTTHKSQGSDLGLFGGLMGWDTDDARLPDHLEEIVKAGIAVDIRYVEYGAEHPNTYRLTLRNAREERTVEAISTGGGMIVIQSIDGVPVRMEGDYFETVVMVRGEVDGLVAWLRSEASFEDVLVCEGGGKTMIEIKSRVHPGAEMLGELEANPQVESVRVLDAVLPVLGRKEIEVPFLNCEEMAAYREQEGGELALWELAVRYEAARGGISEAEVLEKMERLVEVFETSITTGLGGTEFEDRILPCQSGGFEEKMKAGALLGGDVMNRIILYVTAMMEMKSSLGVIVAAPTAGSCGALPGAVFGVSDASGKDRSERVKAMMVAGLIGVFITARSTFAAEVAGCMAECGSGSSMAAAAIVGLAGGSFEQQMGAASQALQNSFGMTCDTLANRVEAPCLGKNVMAATNALACANMALANYRHLVPMDQVIDAMREVGDMMPREICCTGLGGLAITPASRELEEKLKKIAERNEVGRAV
jgi:L-serine dehydratase